MLIPFSICCFIQLAVSLLNIIEKQGLGATRFEGFNILEFPSILINDVTIKKYSWKYRFKFFFLTIIRALSKILLYGSSLHLLDDFHLYHFRNRLNL